MGSVEQWSIRVIVEAKQGHFRQGQMTGMVIAFASLLVVLESERTRVTMATSDKMSQVTLCHWFRDHLREGEDGVDAQSCGHPEVMWVLSSVAQPLGVRHATDRSRDSLL